MRVVIVAISWDCYTDWVSWQMWCTENSARHAVCLYQKAVDALTIMTIATMLERGILVVGSHPRTQLITWTYLDCIRNPYVLLQVKGSTGLPYVYHMRNDTIAQMCCPSCKKSGWQQNVVFMSQTGVSLNLSYITYPRSMDKFINLAFFLLPQNRIKAMPVFLVLPWRWNKILHVSFVFVLVFGEEEVFNWR